ncbi:hypothetical protein [Streptomyces sp. NPDC051567]|uniref:hypothetical protein n=1 Tax=Streptomyces sp. NPDC051567 TaxID=3365660 RepID=UPI0037B2C2D8
MNRRLLQVVSAAVVTTAFTGAIGMAPAPAHALAPNVSCGTIVSADSTAATRLNQTLTGSLRNAMNSYRVSCARAIVHTVQARGLPNQAAVIAVTTAIVESVLENNPNVLDHTSVGLFQQQDFWGSTANRLNPAWSTNAFLNELLRRYPNGTWASKQIGVVCQAVQRSAYPSRYQPQASDAQKIVDAIITLPDTSNPLTLPAGTLVKGPGRPDVKVIVSGAGIPVTAADVTRDGYDLSRLVTVTDAAFSALPGAPLSGTVVHDQGGGASRYVVVDGAALPITGAEWSAAGYDTRPDMGVPTSWLDSATGNTLSNGLIVMDQAGTDPSRYVMVNGTALPISGAEWSANGYERQTLMGVPGTWLHTQVARPLANKTVVKNISGTDPTVFVMAGGTAVPLSHADYTGMGHDQRPLERVPGTWLTSATGQGAPNPGTLLLSPGDPTVWITVTDGTRKALTEADFGPGKLDFADVIAVPTAFLTALPITT